MEGDAAASPRSLVPGGDHQPRCVLLAHGSFNPVHRHHVQMMMRAKDAANEAGYKVVKAIMAPTAQEYLQFKGVQRVRQDVRLEALAAAVAHLPWLEVDPRGEAYGSGCSMLRSTVLPELEIGGDLVGFNVIGADVGLPRKHGMPCVLVGRGPASGEGLEIHIAEMNDGRDVPHLFVPVLDGAEASSTLVRRALQRGVRSEVDELCGDPAARVLWRAMRRPGFGLIVLAVVVALTRRHLFHLAWSAGAP